MSKKSKKGGGGTVIAFIIFALVAYSFLSAMPWLVIIIALLAVCIALGNKESHKPKQKSVPVGSSPLALTVNRKIEIMNECVRLINTSANLQTVIARYDLLMETLQQLSEYENNPAVSFPHERPSAALARISGEKPQIMNRAIQRAYDDVLHRCAVLTTEKGRKNRQLKFFDELNVLMDSFPRETQDFVIDFINQNINDPLTELKKQEARDFATDSINRNNSDNPLTGLENLQEGQAHGIAEHRVAGHEAVGYKTVEHGTAEQGTVSCLKFSKGRNKKVKLEGWKIKGIRFQTKKLSENVAVVNTSGDYAEAAAAFDAACTALRFLSDFTDEEIRAAGCSISKSPEPYLAYLLENKEELLEKVRLRSHSS